MKATAPQLRRAEASTPRLPAAKQRWDVLTGEFPPQPGGVSDHTQLLAFSLASAGDQVHIWAPRCEGSSPESTWRGVTVHRLPDHFGARGRAVLDRELPQDRPPTRVLLQYVPYAFGMKAMNLPLCEWVFARRHRYEFWTMYHEVCFPWEPGQPIKHKMLSGVHRLMAMLVARASRRILVSTTAWESLLRPMLAPAVRPVLAAVPSNIATSVDPAKVASLRASLGIRPRDRLIGHFGSFSSHVGPLLHELIPPILSVDPDATALLIGRGAAAFVAAQDGAVKTRMIPAEDLPAQAVADHLAACDLVVQPYPDGATTRRSSLMAALALGLPVASTEGHLTESIWRETGAVALAPAGNTAALVSLAGALLQDAPRRAALAAAGLALYRDRFDLKHTANLLRNSRGGQS